MVQTQHATTLNPYRATQSQTWPQPSLDLAAPATLRVQGGERVRVTGTRIREIRAITLETKTHHHQLAFALAYDGTGHLAQFTYVDFLAPPLATLDPTFDPNATDNPSLRGKAHAQYVQATVHFATTTNQTYPQFLFYSLAECRETGKWAPTRTECVPCPEGGFCPGGGRVWSTAGYWNRDEWTAPAPCQFPLACRGRRFARQTATQNSECAPGFQGDFCLFCQRQHFRDGPNCRPCAEPKEEKARLAVLGAVAASLLAVAWTLLAVASVKTLPHLVNVVKIVQGAVVVAQIASPWLPRNHWVADLVSAGAVFNFDLAATTRPGCGQTPILTYREIMVYTLGTAAAVTVLVAGSAAAAFAAIQHQVRKHRAGPWTKMSVAEAHVPGVNDSLAQNFQRRARSAVLLVAVLFYLQITRTLLAGVHCIQFHEVDADGQQRTTTVLRADPNTTCYGKEHVPLAATAWTLLAVVGAGMPLAMARELWQAFRPTRRPKDEEDKDEERSLSLVTEPPSSGQRIQRGDWEEETPRNKTPTSVHLMLPNCANDNVAVQEINEPMDTAIRGDEEEEKVKREKEERNGKTSRLDAVRQQEDQWGTFLVGIKPNVYWFGAAELALAGLMATTQLVQRAGWTLVWPLALVATDVAIVHKFKPFCDTERNTWRTITNGVILVQVGVLWVLTV